MNTPRGEAKVITLPKAVSTAHAGEPDMPMTGIPVLIGDHARMNIRVLDAQYRDFEGIEVAPSKGDFPRTVNPDDVPYTYGACYNEDAFFPASNVGLYEPYIIRDFRGQNMVVYPFAYNPATKTLRVYYNMTVEMYKVDDNGSNTIETRRSNTVKMDPDFKSVYKRHFINYEAAMNRYTPLDEEGDLLIICYDNFISSMTDFVNWKKTRGINTTIVGTSTAGSTYSAIKTYIQNQYNANNNISHVLLVGDVAQIPGYSYSGGGSSYSGLGDNAYGQIVGSDIFNDVIIGRFSASSAARVTTQCNRVITYERDLTTSDTWLKVGQGISRKEGGSGHNNEDDYQHIDNIRTDLLNYGYTPVYQRYANLTGYTATSSQISSDINSGVGIINYANHGQETAWGANSSGYVYYAVSHVNALTNENKLPFIFSVACLVGKYDHSSDCFAEAWMNATNNNNPTGAIGTLMSYISQPWIPPMWAQDECVDIITGNSSSTNDKVTFGGVCINGLFSIFDNYSTSTQQAVGTYQAWIVFGDPSLMLRTKTPQAMTVSHNGSIAPSATSYAVTVSNGNGAVATITDASHNILGKATVSNGSATISINGTLTAGTELTLCVFGYNKVTYLGTISVNGGTPYTITANASPTAGGTVSGGGTYYSGQNCTLTATPNTGYTFTNWKKGNTVVSNEASYTFTVSESATFTATFTAIPQYTITVQANPTAGGSVSGGGSYYSGASCTLTSTANAHYEFANWTKNGTQVSTANPYTFTVTAAGSYVANFNALTPHTVTCATVENGTISASPTTAYKNETVTLSATPASGYYFSAWDVRDASNNPITVTDNQFTMPDSNVTVSATFVPGYTVTLASVANGSISATPTHCTAGTTIFLTATPASGYTFDSWVVYKTGDLNTTVTVSNNQFSMPAYDVTVSAIFLAPQGGDVTIGSGTSYNAYIPTYAYYGYTLSQQIYPSADMGSAGTITKVAFKVSNSKSTTRTIDIYMSHTSTSTFSSATSWIAQSTTYRVFSGSVTFSASGWTTITLDTPFAYNGTSNLLLTVDDNTGSYVSSSSASPQFYVYSTSGYTAIYKYNDGTNYNPASMSTSGTRLQTNNQVVFTKETPSTEGYLSVSPNSLTGFEAVGGSVASEYQSVAVIGANLQSNVTVTLPNGFEACTTPSGNYASSLTLTPSNGSLRQMLYVRLAANLNAGSYTGTMTLVSGTTTATVSLSGTVTQGAGTQYTVTAVASPVEGGTVSGAGSYYESTTCTLTATANAGYVFDSWSDGNTDNPRSFVVTGDATYTALFIETPAYDITVSEVPNGTIGADKTTAYPGETVTLTVNANTGFILNRWLVYKTGDINTLVEVTNSAFIMPEYDVTVFAVIKDDVQDITIGGGTDTEYGFVLPTHVYYNYCLSQQIYTSAEVGDAGTITAFKIYFNGDASGAASPTGTRTFNVYMTHTSSTTVSAFTPVSPSNLVYTGSMAFEARGWYTFTLNTPFEYDGTSNLMLTVDDNTGSYSVSARHYFYDYSTGRTSSIFFCSDDTNFDPTSNVTATSNYGTCQYNNQIIFTKGVDGGPTLSALPNPLEGFAYKEGEGPSDVISFALIGVDLTDNVTVSSSVDYEICATEDGTFGSTLTFNANTLLTANIYVRLKVGLAQGTHNGLITLVSGNISTNVNLVGQVNQPELVSQTVDLEAGWNWWAPTVVTSVEAVQNDLGSNLQTILSDNGEATGELVPGQMVRIRTTAACSLTVNGTRPDEITVTLASGYNWVGFAATETMGVTEVFAAINPVEGDKIISQDEGFAIYNGTAWEGTLTNLHPGQGYVYISQDYNNKTLSF